MRMEEMRRVHYEELEKQKMQHISQKEEKVNTSQKNKGLLQKNVLVGSVLLLFAITVIIVFFKF
jgi:hypothetical protein